MGFRAPGSPGVAGADKPSPSASLDLKQAAYAGNTGPNIARTKIYTKPELKDGKRAKGKGKGNTKGKDNGEMTNTAKKGRQTGSSPEHSGVFRLKTSLKGKPKVVDSWEGGNKKSDMEVLRGDPPKTHQEREESNRGATRKESGGFAAAESLTPGPTTECFLQQVLVLKNLAPTQKSANNGEGTSGGSAGQIAEPAIRGEGEQRKDQKEENANK